MLARINMTPRVLPLAASLALAAIAATSLAQKVSVPKPQDKLAIAEPHVTQLLLLMETDKNGKISKQEWMKFMAAEFDRLDKSKAGALNVKALKEESKVRPTYFTEVGK
jgi:hypothetical protein